MSHVTDGALHAYLDGACDERERREIEAHLEACGSCRARRDEAAAVSQRASDLLSELEPLSPEAPAWREIEARAAARRGSTARRSRLRPLAWAASIVIAFGLGWMSQSLMFMARSPADMPSASAPAPRIPAPERDAVQAGRTAEQGIEEEAYTDRVGRSVGDQRLDDLAREAVADAARPRPAALQKAAETETEERASGVAEGAATDPERRDAPRQRAAEPRPEAAAAPPAEKTEIVQNRRRDLAAPFAREAAEEPSDVLAARRAALPVTVTEEVSPAEFLPVQPAEAAVWLGAPLVTLPELDLQRVEVGPGTRVDGATAGLPLVRMTYLDAAGHEIVLLQQRIGSEAEGEGDLPAFRIDPDGATSYRWRRDGYWLALQAALSSDSLRSLADRVH